MKKTLIDMSAYPRKPHFDYFRNLAYPYVGLTAEVDVTAAVRRAKAEGWPVSLCLIYAVSRAANAVPAFRQRIAGEGVVEYDRCIPSHTVAKADGTYAYCETDPDLDLPAYIADSLRRQDRARQEGGIVEESDPESLFFLSCTPWTRYTALVQPTPSPADSNPRITWGKYGEENGAITMPLSVLVHHALIDGRQIAQFYEAFDREMDAMARPDGPKGKGEEKVCPACS